jgi:hypothetical protein
MTTDIATTSKLGALLDSYEGEVPESAGTGLGTFYWLHGTNKGGAKTNGVFYIKDTELAEPPAAPWQADERYEDQTEPEYGYSTALLRIAPIIWHSQWYMPERDEDGEQVRRKGPRDWRDHYESGMQKHTDLICLVEGIDDPLVLSADGKYKSGALIDIIRMYRNGLLRKADFQARKRGKRAVPWMFWLPIAQKKRADGTAEYVDVIDPKTGKKTGSVVTPPTLYLPPDAIESLLVTEDQLKLGGEIFTAFLRWSRELRTPRDVTESAYTSGTLRPLVSCGGPQPVDEEEF